jgi:hypothetical protein
MRRLIERKTTPATAPTGSGSDACRRSRVVLFVRACVLLLRFEYWIRNRNFCRIYDQVRLTSIDEPASQPSDLPDQICHAVDLACIWYWRPVLCLQRSAATCCLLKANGFSARLVIGVRQLPFRAHAWVELNGAIVNDKPYLRTMYAVLDEF